MACVTGGKWIIGYFKENDYSIESLKGVAIRAAIVIVIALVLNVMADMMLNTLRV